MSIPYPAQREDEQLEWIGGSIFSVLLLSGGGGEHELREGGVVFLSRRIPHGCTITSAVTCASPARKASRSRRSCSLKPPSLRQRHPRSFSPTASRQPDCRGNSHDRGIRLLSPSLAAQGHASRGATRAVRVTRPAPSSSRLGASRP